MTEQPVTPAPTPAPAPVIDPEKQAANKNLEAVAWGFFLIMLGCQWLIPDHIVPNGVWTIALGLILLGLNVMRYYKGLRMSGFTTFFGILFVLGGIGDFFGLDLGVAVFLIVLGIYFILKQWFEERQLFGKAEQS